MATQLESIVVDDLDRQLVDRLRADGRESNRSLAQALGVNETTVATRLRRLERARAVRVVAVTDMHSFGLGCMGFALIRVAGRPARAVAEDVAGLPESIGVVVTSGGFDVIATLLTRDLAHLAAVVGESIRGLPGVATALCEPAVAVPRLESGWVGLTLEADPRPQPAVNGEWHPLDLGIIAALQRDARSSNRSIAAALGVSEATVRVRLRRLEEQRCIRIQPVCDVGAFGLTAYAFLTVQARAGAVAAAREVLLAQPELGLVARTLGGADFVGLAVAPTREQLLDATMRRIGEDPAVQGVRVFETCDTVKHVHTWARLT